MTFESSSEFKPNRISNYNKVSNNINDKPSIHDDDLLSSIHQQHMKLNDHSLPTTHHQSPSPIRQPSSPFIQSTHISAKQHQFQNFLSNHNKSIPSSNPSFNGKEHFLDSASSLTSSSHSHISHSNNNPTPSFDSLKVPSNWGDVVSNVHLIHHTHNSHQMMLIQILIKILVSKQMIHNT
jgi:hypothetical protein